MGMNLTQEQFNMLLQTLQTPEGSNTAILIFIGLLAAVGIISVVWFILNIRLKPVESLEHRLEIMQQTLNSMNSKLWTQETLDLMISDRIHNCIKEHERDCPIRAYSKKLQHLPQQLTQHAYTIPNEME